MAKVGIIVVSYRTDAQPLFASIAPSRHEVRWYIFIHGTDPWLRSRLDALTAANNARCFPYGVNRGVARSWNDGVLASRADGNEVTLILNDDIFFYDDAFDQFIEFVLVQTQRAPDFGVIMTYGMEPAGPADARGNNVAMTRVLSLGACFALGAAAIEKVGFFDENFWPAYLEDFDYHYRLGLAGLPLLCDERTLLQHQRSATVRRDRFIAVLHGERLRRNDAYYVRKWGGGPDQEMFAHPFSDGALDYFISAERRASPYGPAHDRSDLGSAALLGFLEGSRREELLALLHRNGCVFRHVLAWGGGDSTIALAECASLHGARFFVSIDHDEDRLRRTMASLPRYPFLHFRCIGCDDAAEAGVGGDPEIDYVTYPQDLGVAFDLVIVGGKWRLECALSVHAVLDDDGFVILHDEERIYHDALHRFLADRPVERAAPGITALNTWQRGRDAALHALYETVEESGQFLVLRPKRRPARPRSRQRRGGTG